MLALATAAGAFAATRSAHLGMAARPHAARVSDATVAAEEARLVKAEHALDVALHRKLPPLPRVPKRVSPPPAAPVAQYTAAVSHRVVYVRSAPTTAAPATHHGEPSDHGDGGGRDD
jgi:hypothetical protein